MFSSPLINILFNLACALAIVCTIQIVTCNNPLYSVFFMILLFFASSVLLLLNNIDFLALLFLIIYVGAIAVLVLFVIMTFNTDTKNITHSQNYLFHQLLIGFLFLFPLILALYKLRSPIYLIDGISYEDLLNYLFYFDNSLILSSNLRTLGMLLYTHFFLPFIFSGILLFVSMVGVIVINLKNKPLTNLL